MLRLPWDFSLFSALNCSQIFNTLKPCRHKVLPGIRYTRQVHTQTPTHTRSLKKNTQARAESHICQRLIPKKNLEPMSPLSELTVEGGGGRWRMGTKHTTACVLLSCHQQHQQFDKSNTHLSCSSPTCCHDFLRTNFNTWHVQLFSLLGVDRHCCFQLSATLTRPKTLSNR